MEPATFGLADLRHALDGILTLDPQQLRRAVLRGCAGGNGTKRDTPLEAAVIGAARRATMLQHAPEAGRIATRCGYWTSAERRQLGIPQRPIEDAAGMTDLAVVCVENGKTEYRLPAAKRVIVKAGESKLALADHFEFTAPTDAAALAAAGGLVAIENRTGARVAIIDCEAGETLLVLEPAARGALRWSTPPETESWAPCGENVEGHEFETNAGSTVAPASEAEEASEGAKD